MIKTDEIIKIGKFQKTHALKGELNMILEIDPEYFIEGNPLIIDYDGILVPYYVETVRQKGSESFLIKLEGIDSEKEASQFVNKAIFMLKKDADEWLSEDFVDKGFYLGLKVIDADSSQYMGIIRDIEDSTTNTLFIIRNDKEEELYIPANEDFIVEVDEDRKEIRMKLPEGLLDIN